MQGLEFQWRIRTQDVRAIVYGYWRQKLGFLQLVEPLVQASIDICADSVDVPSSLSQIK